MVTKFSEGIGWKSLSFFIRLFEMIKEKIYRVYGKRDDKMGCHFCESIFERNKERGLPEESSIIYKDESIYVMPDICPLSVGHMLIISQKHYQGYANAGEETLIAIEKFLEFYKTKIGNRNYTIFEHGAVRTSHAGASVEHAHMHLFPFEIKMGHILKHEFENEYKCSLTSLPQFAKNQQSYLYYKTGNDAVGYAYPVGKIESQYLRKIANNLIMQKNVEGYDWKKGYLGVSAEIYFRKTLAWWNSLTYPLNFKWSKKLILEKYHLVTYKELINDINRFSIYEAETLIKIIEKELEYNSTRSYRVILVSSEHQYFLPNYVVEKKNDLCKLKKFIYSNVGFQEIWYFCGESRASDETYAGRLSYTLENYNYLEIIELISGDNLRPLEKYSLGNNDIDYIRLSRRSVETVYRIDWIQIESQCNLDNRWLKIVNTLKTYLNLYQTRLANFLNMMKKYGITSFSVDFKMGEKGFQFIDWDTSYDEIVLDNEKI